MAKVRAYEITNLVLSDDRPENNDKYLIQTTGVKRDTQVPLTVSNFVNIYLGREHRESCQNAYNELRP